MAEARARERAAIVYEEVAHHALSHRDGADGFEGKGAEVQRRREDHVPARTLGHEALGHGLGEVPARVSVHPEGQMRAMGLERARGQDDDGALARQGIEGRARELFEEVDAQKLDPFVAAR